MGLTQLLRVLAFCAPWGVQPLCKGWMPLFCQSTHTGEETSGPAVSPGPAPLQPPGSSYGLLGGAGNCGEAG